MRLGAEKTGPQILPNEIDAVAAEGLKTAQGIDDKVQRVHDPQEVIRNSDGRTPLHVAARDAHLEAARMIIGQGADMNARDNNGWTPLQEATSRGYFDMTRLLLEHGATI